MLENKQLTQIFWDAIDDYDEEIVSVFSVEKNNVLIDAIEAIDDKGHKSIIDVGCGVGKSFKYISSFEKKYAIDSSANMIRKAKEHINSKGIMFYKGDALDFSLNCKCDFAMAIMSLFPENDIEYSAMLRNIMRHLKHNGELFLVVHSFESAVLYLHYLARDYLAKGMSNYEVEQLINKEASDRKFHPFGLFEMNSKPHIIQKHWIREELEMFIEDSGYEMRYINKLELDFTAQYKFSRDVGTRKLWYWFCRIGIR